MNNPMQTLVENQPFAGRREQTSSHLSLPDGLTLHYVAKRRKNTESHREGFARAIILVHGYSDSWRSFEEMLDLLPFEDNAVPVFALDLRGHGSSSEAPSGTYNQQDFADDLAAFMNGLHIQKAIIVGHSMGGFIAHQFALTYPDKVDRLVLISTTATLADWSEMTDLRADIDSFADEAPAPVDFVQAFQESTFYAAPAPSVLHRYVSESLRLMGRVWKRTLRGLERENHRAQLAQIAAPTLILWGEQDTFFNREEQEELASLIPDARLVTYPEAGHALNIERTADIVRDIARFVQEPASRPLP